MQAPPVVSRSEWLADPFKGTVTSLGTPERLVVHHAAGYAASNLALGKKQVKAIQRLHQGPTRNWSDIGYHFLIDAAGNVYQGRPYFKGDTLDALTRLAMGAHVLNQNSRKVGICLLGCFHLPAVDCEDVPTERALITLRETLRFLLHAYRLPATAIGTHRDFLATSCPGDKLYNAVQAVKAAL
jgi:hypothetical protein